MSSVEQGLASLSRHDSVMRQLVLHYPAPTFTPHTDYYEELASSIISQQLSVKAAATIQKRFCELFGKKSIPSADKLANADLDLLRSAGLSRAKASYIVDLAQKTLSGEIEFDKFAVLSNQEIAIELVRVKGIGEWTAHMFLMFCMGRLDVLPVGDLGIRNGVTLLYGLDHQANADDVRKIAAENSWNPYESIASWYIWKSLDNTPNK